MDTFPQIDLVVVAYFWSDAERLPRSRGARSVSVRRHLRIERVRVLFCAFCFFRAPSRLQAGQKVRHRIDFRFVISGRAFVPLRLPFGSFPALEKIAFPAKRRLVTVFVRTLAVTFCFRKVCVGGGILQEILRGLVPSVFVLWTAFIIKRRFVKVFVWGHVVTLRFRKVWVGGGILPEILRGSVPSVSVPRVAFMATGCLVNVPIWDFVVTFRLRIARVGGGTLLEIRCGLVPFVSVPRNLAEYIPQYILVVADESVKVLLRALLRRGSLGLAVLGRRAMRAIVEAFVRGMRRLPSSTAPLERVVGDLLFFRPGREVGGPVWSRVARKDFLHQVLVFVEKAGQDLRFLLRRSWRRADLGAALDLAVSLSPPSLRLFFLFL
mmetsp:Transcript_4943/g.9908  ORF Transcript_4943/g.9908 Transcript_4943/m.9908 type:complete len:380 (-) Transcript_4943:433-1572(-)